MFAGVNYSTHTAVNFSTPVFVSVTVLLNGEEEWACFFWILFFCSLNIKLLQLASSIV